MRFKSTWPEERFEITLNKMEQILDFDTGA